MNIEQARTAVASAVAVGAATTLIGSPVSAHPAPFIVTAGSAPAGTSVAVTKTSSGTTPQLVFKDTTTGTQLQCTSSLIKGSVPTGSTNGSPVVTLNGASVVFNGCTGPAGLAFRVTGYGTWYINIADSTNGVSSGTVTNVRAHVQSTSGPNCGFDIGADTGSFSSSGTSTVAAGSRSGSYVNSTQSIVLPASNPGTLGIWNVKGGTGGTNTYCVSPSVLKQSDKASFSATYKLTADTAAYNPIAIN